MGPDFERRAPVLLEQLVDEWGLSLEVGAGAQRWQGSCAQVLAVRTPAGVPAVLKVSWPHPEAAQEHLALSAWNGAGAVRLLRADPARHALLLERLSEPDLSRIDDLDACATVAELYRRLHRPASPALMTLSEYLAQAPALLAGLPRNVAVPHRLVDQARAHLKELLPACDGTVIHTDLHYENVLTRAQPSGTEWVAIDPKPLSGEPAYEVSPLLVNRFDELGRHPREGLRERFFTVVDAAGIDEERAKAWVVVRTVLNALDDPESAALTVMITKALSD